MPSLRLRKLLGAIFERLGLDDYLERQLARLRAVLTRSPVSAAGASGADLEAAEASGNETPAAAPRHGTTTRPAPGTGEIEALVAALEKHPDREGLLSAGTQKDQLLRSLVPLYLARDLDLEVNSGVISRFWQTQGVSYATSNAAKALRQNEGYTRAVAGGRQITPTGVSYVEAAIANRTPKSARSSFSN